MSKPWRALLVVGALMILVRFLLPAHVPAAAVFLAVGTASVLVLIRVGRRTGGLRSPWTLLAAGFALWVLGDAWWALGEGEGLRRTPGLDASDVPYMGAYALFALGLLRLRPVSARLTAGVVIDAVIFTLGFGLMMWALLSHPHMAEAGVAGGIDAAEVMGYAYPLVSIVLVSVFVRFGPEWRRTPACGAIILGFLVLATADLLFHAAAVADGLTAAAPFIEAGWLICPVLVATAGLHPTRGELGATGRALSLSGARLVFIGFALLTAPAILLVRYWNGESIDDLRVGLVVGLVLLVLVFVRMTLVMSELSRTAGTLESTARTDPLTGLPNRRAFIECLDGVLEGADRYTSVLLVDIERFKGINDALGPAIGDAVLVEAAQRLAGALEGEQVAARMGADDFAVYIPGHGTTEHCYRTATAIHELFEAPFELNGIMLSVEVRIGIAVAPRDGSTADTVLRRAEMANTAAKDRQEKVLIYNPGMDTSDAERLMLLSELRTALDDGELVLYFQPQVELSTGRVTSVEALVRWLHPARGLLPPAVFLPFAEQTVHIRQLTRYVLDAALAQCRLWRDQGMDLIVAVNLSARNLLDPALVDDVREALERYDLPPSVLDLEITESSAMVDPVRALEVLTELRDLGTMLSVDDYGTGHSSLSYLQRLPVERIKLDRSFVSTMLDDESNEAIVRSTIELARHLSLSVIAEGVEDESTLDHLRALSCYAAQGYGLSRPVPAADVPTVVAALDERMNADSVLRLVSVPTAGEATSGEEGTASAPASAPASAAAPSSRVPAAPIVGLRTTIPQPRKGGAGPAVAGASE